MMFRRIIEDAINEADINNVSIREKEAFLQHYYSGQIYEFMTHEEIMAALRIDGTIQN